MAYTVQPDSVISADDGPGERWFGKGYYLGNSSRDWSIGKEARFVQLWVVILDGGMLCIETYELISRPTIPLVSGMRNSRVKGSSFCVIPGVTSGYFRFLFEFAVSYHHIS